MWKDYSREFIKKNRVSSLSVLAAAFISAYYNIFMVNIPYSQ